MKEATASTNPENQPNLNRRPAVDHILSGCMYKTSLEGIPALRKATMSNMKKNTVAAKEDKERSNERFSRRLSFI
jgi:hypothetical protein